MTEQELIEYIYNDLSKNYEDFNNLSMDLQGEMVCLISKKILEGVKNE